MADILRRAEANWDGDLRGGKGRISASSGAIKDTAYSFTTRFENEPGTNPEELLAAAHAACFSMNLSGVMGKKGYQPGSIHTQATCVMSPKEGGGFRIAKMRLQVEGHFSGIDQATFQQVAEEAERTCPVSALLRPGLDEVTVEAKLV